VAEARYIEPSSRRAPISSERQAAVGLARDLRRVTYPAKARIKVKKTTPPGSLRISGAMRQEQQRLMGQQITGRAFRTVRKERTIYTPLSVGIMCDISGSMAAAQEPLAVARWVLADALHQVQGTVATVLFGNHAHPIQAPREHVRDIQVYDGMGGHENYMDGFALVDSALDLIDGDGARLLVIITDGHFVLREARQYAEETMDMCRAAGVAVIWLKITDYFAREDAYGHGTVLDVYGKSPVEIADLLGQAAVEEFKRVAPQRQIA
jgi:hypothetical protein